MLSLESRKLEEQALKRAHNKLVTAYLRGIILSRLKKIHLSGYGLLLTVNQELKLSVSPGTLYSNLYALERLGLVECGELGQKRMYKLTVKGETVIQAMQESSPLKQTILRMTKEVFPGKENKLLSIGKIGYSDRAS